MSRVSAHGSPRRGNAITEIAENSVSQALTKPSRENVYSVISSLEAETLANHLLDAESRSQIAAKTQKEAETFFSSISEGSPGVGRENEFRHISVTALPPWPTKGCHQCHLYHPAHTSYAWAGQGMRPSYGLRLNSTLNVRLRRKSSCTNRQLTTKNGGKCRIRQLR